MKKILVSGANGQLGSELRVISTKYNQFEWFFANREQLSLDDLSVLKQRLEFIKPDTIINCAAYTAVDKAEIEPELADTINHKAVGVLAGYSAAINSQLIHISTDYVFDGNSSIELDEDAPTKPINRYGSTKLLGEEICLKKNPRSIIIRTAWVYSAYGSNFVKTMMRLMQQRDSVNVVNDQLGSPTYAADLAQAIATIITAREWQPGTYNYSNKGKISWYEFAVAIREIAGLECDINGIPSSAYPTAAQRPAFSLLDTSKIASTFGVDIPAYRESLKKCIHLLQH